MPPDHHQRWLSIIQEASRHRSVNVSVPDMEGALRDPVDWINPWQDRSKQDVQLECRRSTRNAATAGQAGQKPSGNFDFSSPSAANGRKGHYTILGPTFMPRP
jgi:hypothetical protein